MRLLYFVASAFSFKFALGDERSWVAMDFQDDNDLLDCLKSIDDESESGSMVLDGVSNSEFFPMAPAMASSQRRLRLQQSQSQRQDCECVM